MTGTESNVANQPAAQPLPWRCTSILAQQEQSEEAGSQLDIFPSRLWRINKCPRTPGFSKFSNMPYGKRDYIISRSTFRISQAKECYPHWPPPPDCYSFFPLKTMFSFYLCVICVCMWHMCAGACRGRKRHQIPWGHKRQWATYMGAGNQTHVSWKSS